MVSSLLQSTPPNFWDLWESKEMFRAMLEPILWRVGPEGLALLLGVPFTFALWQQSESIAPPAILLSLFMGLLLAAAPAGATLAGYVLIVVAVALAYRSIFGGGR